MEKLNFNKFWSVEKVHFCQNIMSPKGPNIWFSADFTVEKLKIAYFHFSVPFQSHFRLMKTQSQSYSFSLIQSHFRLISVSFSLISDSFNLMSDSRLIIFHFFSTYTKTNPPAKWLPPSRHRCQLFSRWCLCHRRSGRSQFPRSHVRQGSCPRPELQTERWKRGGCRAFGFCGQIRYVRPFPFWRKYFFLFSGSVARRFHMGVYNMES